MKYRAEIPQYLSSTIAFPLIYLFILSFVFRPQSALGQTYAPIGAAWTFEAFSQPAFPPHSVHLFPLTWRTIKDTTVLGKNCQLTERQGQAICCDIDKKMVTYDSSGTIFWYSFFRNQFSVFIDFNAKMGDSWLSYYDFVDSCDVDFMVDSTTSVSINGKSLKRLFLHSTALNNNDYVVTQYLGFSLNKGPYPGESAITYCTGNVVDGIHYTDLRCYEDSVIGYYGLANKAKCDLDTMITTGIINENKQKGVVLLYPNPASRQLRLQMPEFQSEALDYTILNSLGQVSLQGRLDAEGLIDISTLDDGMYVILVETNNSTFNTRFLKMADD